MNMEAEFSIIKSVKGMSYKFNLQLLESGKSNAKLLNLWEVPFLFMRFFNGKEKKEDRTYPVS